MFALVVRHVPYASYVNLSCAAQPGGGESQDGNAERDTVAEGQVYRTVAREASRALCAGKMHGPLCHRTMHGYFANADWKRECMLTRVARG